MLGDLNLNGTRLEQEDAEIYIDYFCYGFSAFTIDINDQVAASDANGDGMVLTAADCAYVILGDSLLPPPTHVIEVCYTYTAGATSLDASLPPLVHE